MIEKIDGGAEDEELLLMNTSMVRTNSVKSRGTYAGLNHSKSHDFTALARKFEDQIVELREQNAALELKNKKYLEIIGMSASEI